MTYSAILYALVGIHAAWGWMIFARGRFRDNIKVGDKINVAFGDLVETRTVVRVTSNAVVVEQLNGPGLTIVPKSKTYLPSLSE
jgi:hypothetical protein